MTAIVDMIDQVEDMTADERLKLVKKHFPQFRITVGFYKVVEGWNYHDCNQYRVHIYNGEEKPFITTFTDSISNTEKGEKSHKFDVLYCVIRDAEAYLTTQNVSDFQAEFGYEDTKEASKIFNACKKSYNELHRLFGNEGFNFLQAVTYNF